MKTLNQVIEELVDAGVIEDLIMQTFVHENEGRLSTTEITLATETIRLKLEQMNNKNIRY